MVMNVKNLVEKLLVGYCEMNLMVYVGIYLIDNVKFIDLWEVLEKLKLNDVVLEFEVELL